MNRKCTVSSRGQRLIDITLSHLQAIRRDEGYFSVQEITSQAIAYSRAMGMYQTTYNRSLENYSSNLRSDSRIGLDMQSKLDREVDRLIGRAHQTAETDLRRFLRLNTEPNRKLHRSDLKFASTRKAFDAALNAAGQFRKGRWDHVPGPYTKDGAAFLDVYEISGDHYSTIEGCFLRIADLVAEAEAIKDLLNQPQNEQNHISRKHRIEVETVDEAIKHKLARAYDTPLKASELAKQARDEYHVREQPELSYPDPASKRRSYNLYYRRFQRAIENS